MEGHCDIIRCPEIARPANGRFEGLFCDNRYRSTCRAFCNEGYDLVGSETFECTLDGSWRMEDDELISVPYCQSNFAFCFIYIVCLTLFFRMSVFFFLRQTN